jgi:hypothetical protein
VVRAGARFHTDDAGRQLHNQRQQVLARYLWFDQCRLAGFINAVYGKYILSPSWLAHR